MRMSSSRTHARISLIFATAAAFLVLLPATSAMAEYTPVGSLTTTDPNAAAHPLNFNTTYFQEANSPTTLGCVPSCGLPTFTQPDVKTIVQTFPRGLVANPKATPYCTPTSTALAIPGTVQWSCPDNTQIGTETITALVCGAAAG